MTSTYSTKFGTSNERVAKPWGFWGSLVEIPVRNCEDGYPPKDIFIASLWGRHMAPRHSEVPTCSRDGWLYGGVFVAMHEFLARSLKSITGTEGGAQPPSKHRDQDG